MGCDIHLHIEVKLNGKWEHWANPGVERSYMLFAKMAGVRNNWDIKPLSEPKGLPSDLTTVTQFIADYDGPDGHSHSWLNAKEIEALGEFTKTPEMLNYYRKDRWLDLNAHVLRGSYLCGNSFESRPKGITDVRFVFWFDC